MNQHRTADPDDGRVRDHKQLQPNFQALAKALEFQQLQVDGALLAQVLGLNVDQMALLAEIGGRFPGQLGIALRDIGGKGCSGW